MNPEVVPISCSTCMFERSSSMCTGCMKMSGGKRICSHYEVGLDVRIRKKISLQRSARYRRNKFLWETKIAEIKARESRGEG